MSHAYGCLVYTLFTPTAHCIHTSAKPCLEAPYYGLAAPLGDHHGCLVACSYEMNCSPDLGDQFLSYKQATKRSWSAAITLDGRTCLMLVTLAIRYHVKQHFKTSSSTEWAFSCNSFCYGMLARHVEPPNTDLCHSWTKLWRKVCVLKLLPGG